MISCSSWTSNTHLTTFPVSYLDRNALANARVLNIEKDLNLKGSEFNTCISVFFAGYLTLQIPSNLLLTRVRPSIYLVRVYLSVAMVCPVLTFD